VIFVVDASVAVKWFVEEPRHDLARSLVESRASLIAPDVVLLEVASAFQKKVMSGEMEQEQARVAITTLPECFSELIEFSSLLFAGLELSCQLGHPIYDCMYLAYARMVNCRLITDDRKFVGRCIDRGLAGDLVLLAELQRELRVASTEIVLDNSNELLMLDRMARDTWESICSEMGVNPFGGNLAKHARPTEFYDDSVPRRRLMKALEALTREQMAALLAVAWYGRGTNPDVVAGYHHALMVIGSGQRTEILYVAMQLQHIQIGLQRLREGDGN
jgi:predicted nucleic acid-binding protein